jgi:hypothetical protein
LVGIIAISGAWAIIGNGSSITGFELLNLKYSHSIALSG